MSSTVTRPHEDAADRAARFDLLIATETRRLYGVALAILRDTALAEDAVQETFLLAWKGWRRLHDIDKAAAWLTKICVNHCLRQRQRAKRWQIWSIEAIDHATLPDGHIDTDDLELDSAFKKLTLQQRTVIVLHYHMGYTLDEAAALMNCAPGTVRSHLARALTTLRSEVSHA